MNLLCYTTKNMSDDYYQQMEQVWSDCYSSVDSIKDSESFYREIGFNGGLILYIDKILTHPSLKFTKALYLNLGAIMESRLTTSREDPWIYMVLILTINLYKTQYIAISKLGKNRFFL